MNLPFKILRKLASLPSRLTEAIELAAKKDGCVLAPGARLFPSSRIENNRAQREAITIGAHSTILGQLLVLAHGGTIRIGEWCFLGEGSRLWSAEAITIGDRVLISHNVNLHDHNAHALSAHSRHLHIRQIFTTGHPKTLDDVPSAPIVVEDDAWIGFNATILKGVRIGRGAIVGAGSVVTKDVAPYTVVVGNPARAIGHAEP